MPSPLSVDPCERVVAATTRRATSAPARQALPAGCPVRACVEAHSGGNKNSGPMQRVIGCCHMSGL